MAAIDNPVNDEFLASNYNSLGNNPDWIDKTGDWFTKGIPLAVSAGVSSIWNSVGWVGNKVNELGGGEEPIADMLDSTWLTNDFSDAEDYQTYYKQHESGVELGGFVLGSIIPSGIAVKGLKLLQSGAAISKAASATTGLLTNTAERYWLNKAAMQMAAGESTLGSRLGVALSGAAQFGLEATAMQVATYATMFQSPVFNDIKDVGDFAESTLKGALAFGALGGIWKTAAFKGIKFGLDGATTTTTLRSLENTMGGELSAAAHSNYAPKMAGLKVELDVNGQPINPDKADLHTKLTALGIPDANEVTQGDMVVSLLRAQKNAPVTTSLPLSKVADSFSKTLVAVESANATALDTSLNTALGAMSEDAGIASALKESITDGILSGKDMSQTWTQIFSGARNLRRINAPQPEINNSRLFMNLAERNLGNNVVPTMGDFGKVAASGNVNKILVNRAEVDLSRVGSNRLSFAREAPENVQAKYFTEFSEAANRKMNTPIPHWNLPAIEAAYRKYGTFTIGEKILPDIKGKPLIATKTYMESLLPNLENYIKGAPTVTRASATTGANTAKITFRANSLYGSAKGSDFSITGTRANSIEKIEMNSSEYSSLNQATKDLLESQFIREDTGSSSIFHNADELSVPLRTLKDDVALKYIYDAKQEQLKLLQRFNPDMPYPEIKTRLNVADDFFATSGTIPEDAIVNAIDTKALRHVAVDYAVEQIPDYFTIRSMATQDAKLKLYQDFQGMIGNKILGKDNRFVSFDMSKYEGQNRFAGVITAANPEYGTEAAKIVHNGLQTQSILAEWAHNRLNDFLAVNNRLLNLGTGSKAATELSTIKALVTGSDEKLVIANDGTIRKLSELIRHDELIANGKPSALSATTVVAKVEDADVKAWLAKYLEADATRVEQKNLAMMGLNRSIISRYNNNGYQELYFSPPHPNDFAEKALISDSKGTIGMLYASTKAELNSKVLQVARSHPDWTIRRPEDIDSYHQLLGDYDYTLSLSGKSSIDITLKNEGILTDLAPTTNIKRLIDGFMTDFARSERTAMNNALLLKYGQQLLEAGQMAKALGNDMTGVKKVFDTLFNVYRQDSTWHQFNNMVEKSLDWAGTKTLAKVMDKWDDIKNGKLSISQLEAENISNRYGTDIFGSEALWNLSKANTFTGGAREAIKGANSLIRLLLLGVDYFNGLINIIGTPILALPAIKDAFKAGQDVPYFQLMGDAMKGMFGATRRADLDKYAKLGIVSKDMFIYHDLLEAHATLLASGTSSAALSAANKVTYYFDKFIRALQSPNAYAEQSTQLFAASLADKIGKLNGLSGESLDAFITVWTKKVIGNYTSAQRPLVFQGILGQAVGLFQTYNFNMWQQATRYIANGSDKSAALLAALQGTLFGAQSLPGFNLANQAIASWGGDERGDIYSGARNVLGEAPANLLLYGTASNLLGSNLWARGDMNPRNLTGIPISPNDWAQVTYFGKALGAFKQWGDSILSGGNLHISTLEAIAHANLSRPLTGLAELAMGARTTQGGTLENAVGVDKLSWATAVRLLGAKPMQEAIASEFTYKFGVVKAKEQKILADLGYALRTEIIAAKGEPNQQIISDFSKRYAEAGGSPKGFRRWYLNNLANATTPRAKRFAEEIKNNAWATTYQELASPDEAIGLESPQ